MTFANKLKNLMDELNLTQTKLSNLTGIGKSSISQYLSGKNEPSKSRKKEIARALGVQETYFETFEAAATELNFDNMQMNVYIRHYADSSYREAEKAEQDSLKADIARIKELEAKETLTEDEVAEKEKLINLQYQESRIVKDRSLPNVQDSKFTFDVTDELDSREAVYSALMELDMFKKSKEV